MFYQFNLLLSEAKFSQQSISSRRSALGKLDSLLEMLHVSCRFSQRAIQIRRLLDGQLLTNHLFCLLFIQCQFKIYIFTKLSHYLAHLIAFVKSLIANDDIFPHFQSQINLQTTINHSQLHIDLSQLFLTKFEY